jgi:hypothetical protein
MRERVELCTELEGEHRGVLRDPSQLPSGTIVSNAFGDIATVCRVR